MHDPCQYCPIRVNCDYLSGMCRLSPLEVARFRPDLVRPTRADKLKRRDAIRRQQQIERDAANPIGIFARRRVRQRLRRSIAA